MLTNMPGDKKLPENFKEEKTELEPVRREKTETQEFGVLGVEKERARAAEIEEPLVAGSEIKPAGAVPAGQDYQEKEQRQKAIEKILEDDLEDIYLNMPSDAQQEFKTVGEQTVKEINNLLDKAKVKIKKIISLIKKWLSVIPGINKFFLEQEAKIKADEIVEINKNH